MQPGPFSNQSTRRARLELPGHQLSCEIERGPLAVVLRMKMWRVVFLIEHPNDDPKEHRDNWHSPSIASAVMRDGLTDGGSPAAAATKSMITLDPERPPTVQPLLDSRLLYWPALSKRILDGVCTGTAKDAAIVHD